LKKLIVSLFIIFSFANLVAAYNIGYNILEEQEFFNKSVDPGTGENVWTNNLNWQGFFDTYGSYDANSNFFVRRILLPNLPAQPNYKKDAFFQRDMSNRLMPANVYITTLPSDPKTIYDGNNSIVSSGVYEVGFSVKCNDLVADTLLSKYGLTVAVSWYDASENYLGNSIGNANITTPTLSGTGAGVLSTNKNWGQYRTKVKAPVGAKYFTYSIYADRGVYADFAELEEPFFIYADTPALSLNVVADGGVFFSVFNQTFLKTENTLVPTLQKPMKLIVTINFDSKEIPTNYSSLSTDANLNQYLAWNVYNPRNPEKTYNSLISTPVVNLNYNTKEASITYLLSNWSDLPNGMYVVDFYFRDKADTSKIFSKASTYFYVGNGDRYLGYTYGPVGKNSDGTINQDKNYQFILNGESTFLLGLVDRGVNYGWKKWDSFSNLPIGINPTPITVNGVIYNKYDVDSLGISKTLTYPATDDYKDYLNTIGAATTLTFSYATLKQLGLNLIYPTQIYRLRISNQKSPFATLGYLGYYILYPLQDMYDETLNRDVQNNYYLDKNTVPGINVVGSENIFRKAVGTFKGEKSILGWVTSEELNSADLSVVIDRKNQIEQIDASRPVTVGVDPKDFSDVYNGDNIINYDINKTGDLINILVKPESETWSPEELTNLLYNTDVYIKPFEKLNKACLVNFKLAKKYVAGNKVSLSVGEMITILNNFKQYKYVAGVMFDSASDMTVYNPDLLGDTPNFDYNKFRVFMSEKDNNNYAIPISSLPSGDYNPMQYLKVRVGAAGVDYNALDFFASQEITYKKYDINGDGNNDYEYYMYFNNRTGGNLDLRFSISDPAFSDYTLKITRLSGAYFQNSATYNLSSKTSVYYTGTISNSDVSKYKVEFIKK